MLISFPQHGKQVLGIMPLIDLIYRREPHREKEKWSLGIVRAAEDQVGE
jgi:hypothetical protein